METFFFQSGDENELGAPLLWLGSSYRQFRTIGSLITHLKQSGLEIRISAEDMAELKGDDYSNVTLKLFELIRKFLNFYRK